MVNDMNINEDNNSSANNGGKGKFKERLKNIVRDRRKKKNSVNSTVIDNNQYDARRLAKPFLIIYSLFYDAIKNDNKKHNKIKMVSQKENNLNNNIDNNDNISGESINDTNVNKLKFVNIEQPQNNSLIDNIELNDKETQKLQKEIINLIKKRLVENMNELQILQSELYILKEVTGNDIFLDKCCDDIKEVKKLLSKIKTLKEKYEYLKENTNFDDLLEIGDDVLVDKILELKDMCNSDNLKNTVQNYKILEEYKYLYVKIDKFEDDINKFNDYKLAKEEELKQRDIDFDKLKNDIYDKQDEQNEYDRFVREQEIILNNINDKLLQFDSHEVVNYKLKGFNQLITNSFKYLGLLLASPFKGIIPGIATQTLATKNVIYNLYNNLEWQEERKMVYETIDFSVSINIFKNDLDKTLNLVNATLEDIARLKEKYKKEFSKYEYSFTEYSEIFKKINKMENAIINNKIKINLMQEKILEKEKQNTEKMKRVKKLNCSVNN